MRLGALCSWGNTEADSSLSMLDCYGSETKLWVTNRRPGELTEEGNEFDALYASVNDLRARRARWMQTALYQRGLRRERSYTEKQAKSKELNLGAEVRKETRLLLSQQLNRHHAWLYRRRYARCALACAHPRQYIKRSITVHHPCGNVFELTQSGRGRCFLTHAPSIWWVR
jgi:hypothetical protein